MTPYAKNIFLSLSALKLFCPMAAGCDKADIIRQHFWLTYRNKDKAGAYSMQDAKGTASYLAKNC